MVAFALPFDDRTPGFEIFLLGLYFCWLPGAGLPFWWANAFFWYAVVRYQKAPRGAAVGAVVAAAIGLGFLGWADGVPGPAYWCWVAGMGVTAVGAVARACRRPTPPAPEPRVGGE